MSFHAPKKKTSHEPAAMHYRDRRIADFASFRDQQLQPFWNQQRIEYFNGVGDLAIAYKKFVNPKADEAIVLLPGAAEFLVKYAELAYDLYHLGYSVYIMDHRGQGYSERIGHDEHQLDVESFTFYLQDLHTFLDTVVQHDWRQRHFFGHSLGGLIAACYRLDYGQAARSIILSAPAIYGHQPRRRLLSLGLGLIQLTKQGRRTIPFSRRPAHIYTFEESGSKCVARYQEVVACLQKQPELITNGASFRWLQELCKAQNYLAEHVGQIHTPILLFQAGKDRWVSKAGHDSFVTAVPEGKKIILAESYHDIYIERDSIRDLMLDEIVSFLQQSS